MHDLKHLHILVIEDDTQTREMLRYLLQVIGIRKIYEAENGADGLNQLENTDHKIDVVLCDWNMPCMTGIDLLKALRETNPDLPFIMITGRPDIASVTQAGHMGVNAYLRKPVSPMQLQKKLTQLFN